jgi:hypothetical protein
MMMINEMMTRIHIRQECERENDKNDWQTTTQVPEGIPENKDHPNRVDEQRGCKLEGVSAGT